MGGSSKQTTSESKATEPWKAAQPQLQSILSNLGGIDPNLTGNQSEAINEMVALARAGNPYAPAIDSFATTMLAGGGPDRSGLLSDAYSRYRSDLEGTARGDFLDPNRNPFFAQTTGAIGDDVANRVNSMFAGAGRDLSGAHVGTLGSEIAKATAPIYSSVYNTERANQLAAQGGLFNAGQGVTSLLSGLDQTRLGNMGAGVDAAGRAINAQLDPWNRLLSAETLRTSTPLSVLQNLAGIALPMAQAFGTTTGQSTTNKQMAGAEQFAMIAGGLQNLYPKPQPVTNISNF